MKAGIIAAAAALLVGANAAAHHGHEVFHRANAVKARGAYDHVAPAVNGSEECGCYTVWVTSYGEATVLPHKPVKTKTYAPPPVPTTTQAPIIPSTPAYPLPTPEVTTCPTPGIYTIPESTITVTKETTVCGAATTSVPAGTHTYGGVTTVVETATTIVCPYATVSSSGTVTTSVILETTYVCPSAGTYTIAPLTTTCVQSTVLVYPTPATYAPGTYTHPEVITTITETNYVVVCPYTSSIPAPVKPTYVAPVAPAKPTYVAPVVPAKPTYVAPAPVKASPKPVKSGNLGTSGDHWAITYTPYTSSGSCKDATTVDSDLATVASKGFTTIRLYSADKTDCNGLTTVGDACAKHGLTMIIGIYIKETGIAGAQSQIEDLKSFPHWSIVDLVVVGNEAIFSGFCSAQALVEFITTCKTVFVGCGYSGPVTTTEPLNVLQQYAGTLCGAIDVVGCNIHPFFNADVDASSAGPFVKGQLDIVDGLCPGKSGYNLETGWPSAGRCNGKACPGPSEQAAAISSIRGAVGGKSVMFSYINDEWKDLGEFGCERSWGISGLF